MPKTRILILEDNDERRQQMRKCLDDGFPQFEASFFDSAADVLQALTQIDLNSVALIALDHDLELLPAEDGRLVDPGDGRDVADFLSQQRPTCPVIIHTTNTPAGDGMQSVLEDSGWATTRIVPYGCHEWIRQTWLRAVRDAVDGAGAAGQ